MRGRWIGAALVATVAVGVLTSVAVRSGETLPGTSVAGVDVGELGRAELTAAVQQIVDDRTTGDLPVTGGEVREGVDRGLVMVDLESTVDKAMEAGRVGTPLAAVSGPLFGGGDRAIELVVTVDQKRLRARLDELAALVAREAAVGGFTVNGLDVVAQPPQRGSTLDRAAAEKELVQALREGRKEELALPLTTFEPEATLADVEQVTAAARKALSAPYLLGDRAPMLRLTQREVGPLLRAEPVAGGGLVLAVDEAALAELVTKQAAKVDVRPQEATIDALSTGPVFDGKGDLSWAPMPAQLTFTPGATGLAIDVPATTTTLTKLILAGRGSAGAPLPTKVTEPALSTAEAQSANSLIGTFTTYYQAGQPRATNIARIAEIINGTTIAPGEVMSLNGKAGKRTKERGFVADGAIVDGELVDEVGGGVSQFATTLFNAAFFAGIPIEAHKPHSFYISRYPVGRESTVYFPSVDVKIRNDTTAGILVRTRSTAGSVTVELYGNNGGRQVVSQSGPRVPRGDGGFRVEVTRVVSGGDGVASRRVFKTSYDPAPKT